MSQIQLQETAAEIGAVVTLTGDTGGAISPDGSGNINVLAKTASGSSVSFSGLSHTLTLNVTDANSNTIIGNTAGNGTLSGTANTSVGAHNFGNLTTGGSNAALGLNCLISLTTGSGNTAIGEGSLSSITTGVSNTALGVLSGNSYTGSESYNILVSNSGTVGESNVMRLGTQYSAPNGIDATYIAGITGVTVANQTIVTLNSSTGQLGEVTSVPVANGGTGNTTFTAYSVICAGTTATGAFQNVSGVGSAGNVLTSNGAAALPTWQAAAGGFSWTTATVQTSDATVTTVATISTASNSVTTVEGIIAAAKSDYSNTCGGRFVAVFQNDAGTLTLTGAVAADIESTSTATFTLVASGTSILIRVTGIAATTYNWLTSYRTIVN